MLADLTTPVITASAVITGAAGAVAAVIGIYNKLHPKRTPKPWMLFSALGLVVVVAAVLYFGPRFVPRHAPSGFSVHAAKGYSMFYPEGWKVVEDDVLKTTYRHTELDSPDGHYWLKVDRTPGEDTEPFDKAELGDKREVDAKRPGYKKLTLHPLRLGDRNAVEWTYEQGGNHYADYFLRVAGDGYAVAGFGFDFDTIKERARLLAKSIKPE